jgi:pilus assembly protein Flp/PilA
MVLLGPDDVMERTPMPKRFMDCESGSTAIEYGLIAAIMGLGIILSLTSLQEGFGNISNRAVDGLAGR